MKVKHLIEELQKQDPEREVILQKDAEGNGHSPLEGMWTGAYEPVNGWSGEVGLDELTDELIEEGYDEEDVLEDGKPALILYPRN